MSDVHPSLEQLRAFVQGRLNGRELRDVETHLETCESCIDVLSEQPDSKLLGLARQAATQGFRDAPTGSAKSTPQIPVELRDHPRYHVLDQLGRGGMGAVYRAEHRIMQRPVALKVVHPSLLAHPHAVQRFRREVRVAAKLSHPNIVTAYDADQAGDMHFLVMEFVDGVSLDQWIRQSGRASVEQACDWIRQAALGLQHAHERGMAHRDIKPHNLMLTRDGTLKILDFGLTRLVAEQSGGGETQGLPSTTREGVILGTPDYIAPEQIVDSGSADIRADIYSLGCTLYHLLAGRPPFKGRTIIEKLHAHGSLELPRLDEFRPEIPPQLLAVIARMTAKNPAERYATPVEVAAALEAFVPGANRGVRSGDPVPPPVSASFSGVAVAADHSGIRRAAAHDERNLDGSVDAGLSTITSQTPVPPPVPLSIRPAKSHASKSGKSGKTVRSGRSSNGSQKQLAAVTGGLAAFFLLLIAAAWQLDWFGGGGENGSGKAPVLPPVTTPPVNTSPDNTQPYNTPPNKSSPDNTNRVNTPPVTPPGKSRRVPRLLLLLPSQGLWFTDYQLLVNAVRDSVRRSGQEVQMTVAGPSREPSGLKEESTRGSAVPDIPLNESVTSEGYDALIFIGFDTSEFDPGGAAAAHAARLIREFRDTNKIIASLCAGQRTLARYGLLRERSIAVCPFVPASEIEAVGGRQVEQRVVRDGPIITGSADVDASALVDAIVKAATAN